MNGGEIVRLGPIRPEHATGGWKLKGDDRGRWFLSKPAGPNIAPIQATTATTCAWGIYRANGRMLREASAKDVGQAKAAADAWVREHGGQS
jgi:hypothetical protein